MLLVLKFENEIEIWDRFEFLEIDNSAKCLSRVFENQEDNWID